VNIRIQAILTVFITLIALPVAGQDSVRIRYFAAFPRMDRSSESGAVEIERRLPVTAPGYPATLNQDVDRYFDAISKILADSRVDADWERSVVHGHFVEVTIRIGTRTIRLGSSFNPGAYLDTFPDADGTNERHSAALKAILKLSSERLQEAIPKGW